MTEEQIRNTTGMLIKMQSSLMRELIAEELNQYMTIIECNSIPTGVPEFKEDNDGRDNETD